MQNEAPTSTSPPWIKRVLLDKKNQSKAGESFALGCVYLVDFARLASLELQKQAGGTWFANARHARNNNRSEPFLVQASGAQVGSVF
jgi:hypothetical protein